MGLSVYVIHVKDLVCPKCGEVVDIISMEEVDSGGRIWYPFLEEIGYYVPYYQQTEEDDWYGKDMVLTEAQTKQLAEFVSRYQPYNDLYVEELVAMALLHGNNVVINADW